MTVPKDRCDSLGMRYDFMVCAAVPVEDFSVAPRCVERVLDRISASGDEHRQWEGT